MRPMRRIRYHSQLRGQSASSHGVRIVPANVPPHFLVLPLLPPPGQESQQAQEAQRTGARDYGDQGARRMGLHLPDCTALTPAGSRANQPTASPLRFGNLNHAPHPLPPCRLGCESRNAGSERRRPMFCSEKQNKAEIFSKNGRAVAKSPLDYERPMLRDAVALVPVRHGADAVPDSDVSMPPKMPNTISAAATPTASRWRLPETRCGARTGPRCRRSGRFYRQLEPRRR